MTQTVLRASIQAAAIAFAMLYAGPARALAQAPAPVDARARLDAGFGVTAIRGETRPLLGGALLFAVAEGLHLGVGGVAVLGSTVIEGSTSASNLDLGVAYGGVLVEVGSIHRAGWTFAARALIGVGTARVDLPAVGTNVATDNFGVIEPGVRLVRALTGPFAITAGLGYRSAFAAADLPGVTTRDLSGWIVEGGLTFGRFPR